MKKHFNLHIIASFLCMVVLIAVLLLGGVGVSYAATTRYTSVLDDLQEDDKFNASDYPAVSNNYSLKLIQIAESSNGELFIYVYQPAAQSKSLIATNINMALSDRLSNEDKSYDPTGEEFSGEGFGGWAGGGHGGGGFRPRTAEPATSSDTEAGNTHLYDLTLISFEGVFAKYKVNGLTVSNATTRYYNISTIYRDFDSTIDDEADHDNTINKVAFEVGQVWTATTTADGVQYTAKEIEIVQLTSQMIGMHRYSDGFQFDGTKSLDSHYIAFTCDHKIDKLLSADVEFDTRGYKAVAGSGTTYDYCLTHYRVTLYDYQVASNDGGGWFGKKEDWHRITSTKNFVSEVDLTSDETKTLLSYDWILNFYESEYKNEAGGKDVLISGLLPFGFIWTIVNACTTTGELVFDVSLLRLEFMYDGQIYNLGVVSDIQTGSNKPTNGNKDWLDMLCSWLESLTGVPAFVWKIIICALPFIILLPILSAVFPIVGQILLWILKAFAMILVWLFKGLWWLLCLPFRGIAALVHKIRGD